MCNWFQNKSPTHTFAVDWDTWHGNWAAPCYFNGASPTGSARWGYCLQRHLACEGLYGTVREGTLTLAAAIAFMFAMSMAPQRPRRQWQVNANGRLNALFSMGRGVDGSQLGRYTKVKRVYIVQCTRNWLKHKLTIIFGYFILEILITVVTAKRWCPCAVHHVRCFTRGKLG